MGGRLRYFLHNWEQITQDPWVLQVVSGCPLSFTKSPPLQAPGSAQAPHPLAEDQMRVMEEEVLNLLEKKAIREVSPERALGFYSNVFTVPKKDGGWRPIINLKRLNQYLEVPHFKMESIQSLKNSILPNDYLAKVDLKDAYLSVPMDPRTHCYLRFVWKGSVFEFTSLPFGLAPAPLIFTKLLKPVATFIRKHGVRIIIYLDDMLLMAPTPALLKSHLKLVCYVLTHLGFVLNESKCVMEPQQSLEFLGFMVDSKAMTLALPHSKVDKIRKECRHMRNQEVVTARQLAHLIGSMTACLPAIAAAPLHYRALQRLRSRALTPTMDNYDHPVPLSAEAKLDLLWWIDNLSCNVHRPILPPTTSLTLETDASRKGWGAYCQNTKQRTGGQWSREELEHHINWLELKAAFLGIQSFLKQSRCHILVLMDNRVAIAYVNQKGGTRSAKLCNLALELWNWCLDRDVTVHAEHLPGRLNVIADFESRNVNDSSDWQLDPVIFHRLQHLYGPFSVDLFASFRNAQLRTFYSWKADPQATAIDAFVQNWSRHKPYLFPPFALVGRCLQKIEQEKVPFALLIAPAWPAQTWYSLLLAMLVMHPVILPVYPELLLNPQGTSHPLVLQNHLQLAAWPVSGNPSRRKEFLNSLQISSVRHGGEALREHTSQPGKNGLAGVCLGRLIHFRQV